MKNNRKHRRFFLPRHQQNARVLNNSRTYAYEHKCAKYYGILVLMTSTSCFLLVKTGRVEEPSEYFEAWKGFRRDYFSTGKMKPSTIDYTMWRHFSYKRNRGCARFTSLIFDSFNQRQPFLGKIIRKKSFEPSLIFEIFDSMRSVSFENIPQ